MKVYSIFFFALLFFISAVAVDAQDETRATTAWRVVRYDISATLPSSQTDRNLTARAELNLQNVGTGTGSRLTLRISDKAEVTSVSVNKATAAFNKNEDKFGLQRIVVNLPGVAPNATTSVAVDYRLKVDENSGLNALSPAGSQFLPLSFWYPTPNNYYAQRGGDYAPFRLSVNNAASGSTVIAPGKSAGAAAAAFDQNLNGQPFFITGNWDAVETNGVSVFLPKGAGADERKRADELSALAISARNYAAELFGKTPDAPLKIVGVRRGGGFADGGVIFLDYGVFRRQKIDAQSAMKIAESVAKMHLGNAVQVRGDGFGVVREGLARFVATQFVEKQFGRDAADIERLRQRTAYAAISRRDAPLIVVSPLDDFYYSSAANKGAMIWRLLAKNLGEAEFFAVIRNQMQSGSLTLANLRAAFAAQKTFLDYAVDQPTDMNLLAGLPQAGGAETKVALRNLGSIAAAVNVSAITDKGERLSAQTTVSAKSFGEVSFKSTAKIVRTEIDPEKYYPQLDYSDDVAPREFAESDALSVIKRAFDRKDFAAAENSARTAVRNAPRFDEARIWLGRSLLAQNKIADADREFRAVLEEKLPSAQSLAWANAGLGEIAAKSNQTAQAVAFFNETIRDDAESAATFAARAGRNAVQAAGASDDGVKTFLSQFDRAATSGRKAELDALVVPGEVSKFSSGIGGQAQTWETKLLQIDKLDADTVLAEVALNIKILNREPESGTAIYQLTRVGGAWKLSGVPSFEVR